MDCRQTPQNYNAPNQQQLPTQQQFQKYQPYSSFPSYHHQQQQQQQQQQPHMSFHQNINRNSMMHHIGDGSGNERMQNLMPFNQSYSYNSPAVVKNCNIQQKNSFYDDSMLIKSNEMDSIINSDDQIITMPNDSPFWAKRQETEIPMNTEGDLNIEFFHCTATPKTPSKTRAKIPTTSSSSNPFQPVLETMKKFSSSANVKQALENHQTYFFSHNGDDAKDSTNSRKDEEENEREVTSQSQQASYKSRTKIITIPHGVRIITEIVRDDECGNELFRNFRHLTTKDKCSGDKKSKVTSLTEEDGNGVGNDDNECNSNQSGEDVDEDEEDNGFFDGTRSRLINL